MTRLVPGWPPVLLALLCSSLACGQADRQPAAAGPMVGAVTDTTAQLWAYAGPDPKFTVTWAAKGQQPGPAIPMPASADEHWAGRVTLTGLKPATAYTYQVLRNGQADPAWSGSFTTAPPPGQRGVFTMAFASCMNFGQYPRQPAWANLMATRPAFLLLLGDNVYANTPDREPLWTYHLKQRLIPPYAELIRTTPVYAVWDDHDFGPNDSNGTLKGKETSLRTFREVWANPSYGLPETPGVFFRFAWGDVDFFLCDGRYHRSVQSDPDDEKKSMLGPAQLAWLLEGLKASRAPFKVIASGSTWEGKAKGGKPSGESWAAYNTERQKLLKFIADNRIGGVIYLSGDIHTCKHNRYPNEHPGAYPWHEFVSSGVANSAEQAFITLTFDTQATDPTVIARTIALDGQQTQTTTLKLSDLQAGK